MESYSIKLKETAVAQDIRMSNRSTRNNKIRTSIQDQNDKFNKMIKKKPLQKFNQGETLKLKNSINKRKTL